MNCPKCDGAMEKVTYEHIEIDRCTQCKGIWFDLMERELLAQLKGSESIDSGDPKAGKRLDDVDRISCPVCETQMIRMVDPVQPHVAFEACKVCNGVFLDAGEFTDLKEHTILDRVKSLFVRERD